MTAELIKNNGSFKIYATVSNAVIDQLAALKKSIDIKTAWTARVDMTREGNVLEFVRPAGSISWDETCANAVLQFIDNCISEFETEETLLASSAQQAYDALYQCGDEITVDKVNRMFVA